MKVLQTVGMVCLSYLLVASTAHATRMVCTAGDTARLPVKVTVNVPAFLFLQIGSASQTAQVNFNTGSGLASGRYAGPMPPNGESGLSPSSISGSDASGGVNVRVRANCGQVKLAYRVSSSNGLANGQGQFIPFDTLQTSSSDAGLPAPVLRNAANAESLVTATGYGNLVTDRSAVWRYTYTNPQVPAAGTYQGTVTYIASCL